MARLVRCPGLAARQAICGDMQVQCMPSVPLGQYVQPTAYRATLTGVSRGFPTVWTVPRG